MKADVIQYIKNEKDLAQYQLLILQRKQNNNAYKRLIEIEQEFLNLPLESANFQTVKEIKEAVSLYRKSRQLFYKTYSQFLLDPKINFIKELNKKLSSKYIHDQNIVQSDFFYIQLAKYFSNKNSSNIEEQKRILKNHDLKALLMLEPVALAKQRAKVQISIYSLALYLQQQLQEIENNQDNNINFYNQKIDNIINNLDRFIFKNYNQSINSLSHNLADTTGENSYLSKSYKLINIFDYYSTPTGTHTHTLSTLKSNIKISFDNPDVIYLYQNFRKIFNTSYKKDKIQKIKNKTCGVLFPIERTSQEQMTMLYKSILYKNNDISELFSDVISNIRVKSINEEVYYKGIFLKPAWELVDLATKNNIYNDFLYLLFGHKFDDFEKFNDVSVIDTMNNNVLNKMQLDLSSKILIPQTRVEEEHFKKIMPIIKKIISDIQVDYNKNYKQDLEC